MHTILSLILAFIVAFSAADGLNGLRDTLALRRDRLEAAGDVLQPRAAAPAMASAAKTAADVNWEDISYARFDPAAFDAGVEELTALAEGGDSQALIDRYEELYDQFICAYTLSEVAYIRFSDDVTDQYWSDESVYSETLVADMRDELLTACHQAIQGPCGEDLRAHVGGRLADMFWNYVPMTDRESELMRREAELVDEYYERMNGAGDVTYDYGGEAWTMDMINGFQGADLAYRDYDGYLEVFYGLQKVVCDQVGPLFEELVDIRAEQADIAGYESYADLAYEQTYMRDYTTRDAQVLCDAVKPIARSYFDSRYYAEARGDTDDVTPQMDESALLDALGACVAALDPELEADWQYMTEHGLADIGFSEDRLEASYTTDLLQYGTPVIFSTLWGDFFDLSTLTHEFGHFADMRREEQPDPFISGSIDLQEIPSTTLEALGTFQYGDVYDTGADTARSSVLCGLVESVIDGCIFDELQRRIYADPDMTAEDISALYADISADYGVYEPTGKDYYWVYISHNFDVPLYYISYAVSALAAIQIWDVGQQDLSAAVDLWKDVTAADPYTEQYLTVLPECGLRLFTEEGAVEEICAPLLEELDRLAG